MRPMIEALNGMPENCALSPISIFRMQRERSLVIRPGEFLGMTISGFGSPVDSTGVQQPDLIGSSLTKKGGGAAASLTHLLPAAINTTGQIARFPQGAAFGGSAPPPGPSSVPPKKIKKKNTHHLISADHRGPSDRQSAWRILGQDDRSVAQSFPRALPPEWLRPAGDRAVLRRADDPRGVRAAPLLAGLLLREISR